MKIQINIIPFALILSFILTTIGLKTESPTSKILQQESTMSGLMTKDFKHYPSISTKKQDLKSKIDFPNLPIFANMFNNFATTNIKKMKNN